MFLSYKIVHWLELSPIAKDEMSSVPVMVLHKTYFNFLTVS